MREKRTGLVYETFAIQTLLDLRLALEPHGIVFDLKDLREAVRELYGADTCEARGYACCEGRIPAPKSCIVNGKDSA